MADSDVKGSEMPEGSEPEWKNLFAAMMERINKTAQETNARMDKMSNEINLRMNKAEQKMSEIIKQETSAVVMRRDLMREEMLTAVREAKQFTMEHKRLCQDQTEEFKEELVAVRQQCEGCTEVVKSKR
ncbi:hypothetical protein E2C01_058630 [Portunus trituberculatus]|uniref:Uncharacterized protein n=1 Tax=Portunus trituberculatus TaxID=210409 RepID=A0A5B7H383_PORTR|nr:hypothetical protein [Portunus trituberculatus]